MKFGLAFKTNQAIFDFRVHTRERKLFIDAASAAPNCTEFTLSAFFRFLRFATVAFLDWLLRFLDFGVDTYVGLR